MLARLHELVQAKIEQRAPEVEIETETRETPKVVIMDALKKSMQARRQTKVRQAVRKKAGKAEPKRETRPLPQGDPKRCQGELLTSLRRRRLVPSPFRCTDKRRLLRFALQSHAASAVEDVKLQKPRVDLLVG